MGLFMLLGLILFKVVTSLSIAIGILSHPKNYERRQAMRKSWLRTPHAFIVGECENAYVNELVRREAELYQDIVLMPEHREIYRNLTYKTIRMMQWAAEIPNVDGLLKVDDDTWVDLEKIALNELRRTYLGVMQEKASVDRRPTSRHYVSPADYGEKFFPPFAFGWGYFVGIDLIHEVLNLEKRILPIEDVSVGIWLARQSNINRVHLDRMTGWIEHHLTAEQILAKQQ